ncbi:MAG: heme exporter protein CcmB [Myxococcota bacterium]|nr:heme exporter protein CcmB [Myxococcota bacterium]
MSTPGFVNTVHAVIAKDIRSELRSKQTVATMLLFGVVLTMVFAFAFVTDPQTNRMVFPGAIWGALFFTGVLGVGRTFAREAEDGAFHALMLSPADRGAVLVAKMVVNVILVSTVMVLVVPLMAIMLHVQTDGLATWLVIQIVSGCVGFAVVATPLAVLAVGARFAEVLLPMVIFPLVTPILIAGVKGTSALMGTTVEDDPMPWLKFTWAFICVFGLLAMALFDRMVTE